ncbi:MAG: cytochrome c [Acidimicrobiales bacterium]|nr:cytochrome c [Acidimicrobiales bacterium]
MISLRRITDVVQWLVGVGAATAVVMLFTLDGSRPPTPREPSQEPLAVGARIYTAGCAGCHGVSGEGTAGPRLAGVLLDAYPDPADIAALVIDGRGTMPAFGAELSDEEIDAVVLYVREQFG